VRGFFKKEEGREGRSDMWVVVLEIFFSFSYVYRFSGFSFFLKESGLGVLILMGFFCFCLSLSQCVSQCVCSVYVLSVW